MRAPEGTGRVPAVLQKARRRLPPPSPLKCKPAPERFRMSSGNTGTKNHTSTRAVQKVKGEYWYETPHTLAPLVRHTTAFPPPGGEYGITRDHPKTCLASGSMSNPSLAGTSYDGAVCVFLLELPPYPLAHSRASERVSSAPKIGLLPPHHAALPPSLPPEPDPATTNKNLQPEPATTNRPCGGFGPSGGLSLPGGGGGAIARAHSMCACAHASMCAYAHMSMCA